MTDKAKKSYTDLFKSCTDESLAMAVFNAQYPEPAFVMKALSSLGEVEKRVMFDIFTTIEQWVLDGECELTTVVTAKEPVNMQLIAGAFRDLGYLVSLDEDYEKQITIKWRY